MTPSAFAAGWIERLTPALRPHGRRAFDLAVGNGRHALPLARAGFHTFVVDLRFEAVRNTKDAARRERLRICGWCADLTMYPLPEEAFDLVVVTRYLQRDLFPSLRNAVKPGGHVIYETFTVLQRALGSGPTSPDHVLAAGELRTHFEGWDVLFSEEVAAPEAVARIVARRPQVRLRPDIQTDGLRPFRAS
jgi:tellurite methyltransferase